MALPASQYSVLDARKIERLDDNTFRCYVGKLQFVSWEVEPVIEVQVAVQERGCVIKLLNCRLQGSQFIEEVNNKFAASMTNRVSWQEMPAGDSSTSEPSPSAAKQLVSNTEMEVILQIPAWCSWLPADYITSVGSSVLQRALNAMVPRFLAQLELDYARWAAGDRSRTPLGSGSL